MSDDTQSIRARLLALVPPDQLPFAEFELRMLTTTLESENLGYIHQHWRPIAVERDALREQLKDKPAPRKRSADVATLVGEESVRFEALAREHEVLKGNHSGLRTRHQKLQEDYSELEAKVAKLEKDLDELLASKP